MRLIVADVSTSVCVRPWARQQLHEWNHWDAFCTVKTRTRPDELYIRCTGAPTGEYEGIICAATAMRLYATITVATCYILSRFCRFWRSLFIFHYVVVPGHGECMRSACREPSDVWSLWCGMRRVLVHVPRPPGRSDDGHLHLTVRKNEVDQCNSRLHGHLADMPSRRHDKSTLRLIQSPTAIVDRPNDDTDFRSRQLRDLTSLSTSWQSLSATFSFIHLFYFAQNPHIQSNHKQ